MNYLLRREKNRPPRILAFRVCHYYQPTYALFETLADKKISRLRNRLPKCTIPQESAMIYEPLRSVIDWPALQQAPWIDGVAAGYDKFMRNYQASIRSHDGVRLQHFDPFAPTEEILYFVCLIALAWMLATGCGVNDWKAIWHEHDSEFMPAVEYNRAVMEWHKESEPTP